MLGRALIPLLLEHEYAVRAFASIHAEREQVLPAGIEIAEADLLDPPMSNICPTLLADCEVSSTSPRRFRVTCARRTPGKPIRVCAPTACEFCCKPRCKAGAKQYIQQSITMAYPDHGDEWITEDMPLNTSPARAAVCAPVIIMENLVRTLATDRLRWCILRGGSFVGPGTFQEKVLVDSAQRQTRHRRDGPELCLVDPCGRYGNRDSGCAHACA